MVSYASLDKDGNLLVGDKFSYDPHKRQDPASITKVWALNTMIEQCGDKWPEFYRKNEHDIKSMMVFSDNGAANRLACRVMNPDIGDVSNLNKGVGTNYPNSSQRAEINKFVGKMNEYAGKVLGFTKEQEPSTHFKTVEGMNDEQHYSTAYDMARLMRSVQVNHPEQAELMDLPKHYKLDKKGNHYDKYNTGYSVVTHDGVKGFKTGTAIGNHGDLGPSSGLGATANGGAFCVMGALTSWGRNSKCNDLADQINTGITAEKQGEIMFSRGNGGKGANAHDVEAVKEIQKALGMKEQTGYYGDKTVAATLKYQQNYNKDKKGDERLPETGMMDIRSYSALMVVDDVRLEKQVAVKSPASSAEALALAAKKPEPEKTVAPKPEIAKAAVAAPDAAKTPAAEAKQAPKTEVAKAPAKEQNILSPEKCKEALRLLDAASIDGSQIITSKNAGHARLEVYAFQTALNTAGYENVKPNLRGVLDKETIAAAADFGQRAGVDAKSSVVIDAKLAHKMEDYLKGDIKLAAKDAPAEKPAASKEKVVEAAADVLKSGTKLSDSGHKTSDVNFAKSNLPVVSGSDKSIV